MILMIRVLGVMNGRKKVPVRLSDGTLSQPRWKAVKDYDTIFLIEKGRLAAQGSYGALMVGNETFRLLSGHEGGQCTFVP